MTWLLQLTDRGHSYPVAFVSAALAKRGRLDAFLRALHWLTCNGHVLKAARLARVLVRFYILHPWRSLLVDL